MGHLFLDKIRTVETVCFYIIKYVCGFAWSENTSLEKLIKNIYCTIDYLKECVI